MSSIMDTDVLFLEGLISNKIKISEFHRSVTIPGIIDRLRHEEEMMEEYDED